MWQKDEKNCIYLLPILQIIYKMRSIHMHDTEQNINYIMAFEAQKMEVK